MNKTVHIFFLSTSEGIPILIHPFDEKAKIRFTENIAGRYGSNPEIEAVTLVRNTLYTCINREIQEWASEKQFFPRFIASLLVFFVFFFFMSFVIRDFIPLIDELLGSTIAAVTTYLVIGRRGQVSKPALEQKIILKKRVDAIQFTQSGFLVNFEKTFRSMYDAQPSAEHYGVLLEHVSDAACRLELEQLANSFSLSPNRMQRIKKAMIKGTLPKLKKPEEKVYMLTQALLLGLNIPDLI